MATSTKKFSKPTYTYIRQVINEKVLAEYEKMNEKDRKLRDKARTLISDVVSIYMIDITDTLRKNGIPCPERNDDRYTGVEDWMTHILVDRLVDDDRVRIGEIYGKVDFITNKIIAKIELGEVPLDKAFDYINKYKITHEDLLIGSDPNRSYGIRLRRDR